MTKLTTHLSPLTTNISLGLNRVLNTNFTFFKSKIHSNWQSLNSCHPELDSGSKLKLMKMMKWSRDFGAAWQSSKLTIVISREMQWREIFSLIPCKAIARYGIYSGAVLYIEKSISTWLRYTPLRKSGSLSHQFTIVIPTEKFFLLRRGIFLSDVISCLSPG